jgi:hypothetical protein
MKLAGAGFRPWRVHPVAAERVGVTKKQCL